MVEQAPILGTQVITRRNASMLSHLTRRQYPLRSAGVLDWDMVQPKVGNLAETTSNYIAQIARTSE